MATTRHYTGMAGGTFHANVPVRQLRGGRMIGGAATLLAEIAPMLSEAVVEQAQDVLSAAQENIRSNPKREGVALGAGANEEDLAVSGYVTTGSQQPYERAKAAMIATGSRDARRGLFAEPVVFEKTGADFSAVVSFAAGRAKLMHDGYGGLSGVPFLDNAFDAMRPRMETRLRDMATLFEQFDVPDFIDVDHQTALAIEEKRRRSERYYLLVPGSNLMRRQRSRDAQMKRVANRAMRRAANKAEGIGGELRALRAAINKINRERR